MAMSPAVRVRTAAQRRAIVRLQNGIRNAINVTDSYGRKCGVEPKDLKWAIQSHGLDTAGLTVRPQRVPAGSELEADYKLWQHGELLFRLKLVPWPSRVDARWHVKRHPEATWWRSRDHRIRKQAGR